MDKNKRANFTQNQLKEVIETFLDGKNYIVDEILNGKN